ncbi:phosphoglycerate dehydrogenase [Patescibacteria group bacterium]|nr:phosphoglycerate dehydrogenase [Patescibacteria group bacterium]
MYKVMLRDNMSPVAKDILEQTGQIEVTVDNDKATGVPERLAEIISEYHGLAVRSGTRITAEVLKNTGRLKVIGRAGIGVDNIDVAAATQQGIVVMNAPEGNTVTTAEHTISLMLSLARNIPQATATIREGKWEKKKLMGVEISGKILGVIGFGHIGRIVADRAKGLKMKVIATDPFVSKEAASALEVELVALDDLLARSDFITLHVPRLKETANMINAASINNMKPGVRIINCSRGEIVQLDDLYDAILSGHVAGAALDVFPTEPPDPSLPLLQHPHVIFTPHLGASTGEAQDKVAAMIAKQIAAFLLSGIITNAVNFPSLSLEVMDQIRPHLALAEKMGSMMGQLARKIHDVTISYSGNISELDTRPLTHAVLKGLLSAFTDKPVNYVNAPALAAEKGIHVHETRSRTSDHFSGLIRLKLEEHAEEPDEIWGTIYEKKYPRLVRIGKIYLDAIPEGSMIVIQNFDKPGVIGNVGTTLGRHNINIGRFQLGRREDSALCMVNIDSPADEKVLEELRCLPNIISVRQVHLD